MPPKPSVPPVPEPGRRRPEPWTIARWVPVVMAGGAGALLSAGLLTITDGRPLRSGGTAAATSSTVALALASQTAPLGFADLAERLEPSLVALSGIAADGRISRGSAIAIRVDRVVTAARVVLTMDRLEVLVGGVGRRATLVGADPETDLAVLAVEGGGLVPVSWGESSDLRPGDPAIAVHSTKASEPGPTVTAGVISGIARTLAHSGVDLRGLLQVDRPVPSEGAGGALLDPAGALVGITLPAPSTAMPFGYAVPAEVAQEVCRQLLTSGRVAHPWLGIEGGDQGVENGALVRRVRPDSPAARAGVLEGDVVTAVNGASVSSMGMLLLELRRYRPGDSIPLVVLRASRSIQIVVTLSERD